MCKHCNIPLPGSHLESHPFCASARDVRPLRGGFKAWQAQGLPVQKVPHRSSSD